MVTGSWNAATREDDEAARLAKYAPLDLTKSVSGYSAWQLNFLHMLNGCTMHDDSEDGLEETQMTNGTMDAVPIEAKKRARRSKKGSKAYRALLSEMKLYFKIDRIDDYIDRIDALLEEDLSDEEREKAIQLRNALFDGRDLTTPMLRTAQLDEIGASVARKEARNAGSGSSFAPLLVGATAMMARSFKTTTKPENESGSWFTSTTANTSDAPDASNWFSYAATTTCSFLSSMIPVRVRAAEQTQTQEPTGDADFDGEDGTEHIEEAPHDPFAPTGDEI